MVRSAARYWNRSSHPWPPRCRTVPEPPAAPGCSNVQSGWSRATAAQHAVAHHGHRRGSRARDGHPVLDPGRALLLVDDALAPSDVHGSSCCLTCTGPASFPLCCQPVPLGKARAPDGTARHYWPAQLDDGRARLTVAARTLVGFGPSIRIRTARREKEMSKFEEYQVKYKHATMERRDGIIQMTLHSEDGPLKWGGPPPEELSYAFYDVARDHGNRCVIITGTGKAFCAEVDLGGGRGAPVGKTASGQPPPAPHAGDRPTTSDPIYNDAKYPPMNHPHLEVHAIAAVNRPALIHAQLAVLCDIVI